MIFLKKYITKITNFSTFKKWIVLIWNFPGVKGHLLFTLLVLPIACLNLLEEDSWLADGPNGVEVVSHKKKKTKK